MNETESQPVRGSADPFPTFAALRASHSELLERDPETEGDERYLSDVEEFFERARTTGAVLSVDEERRASQSILNYWLTVLYRADRKLPNTTLVELNPDLKPRIQDERCPYPGVREFEETEGKYFFGRQRTIDYLLARLKEESFLALVGPSGSGKSSLVRAGLLPAIKNIGLGAEEDTASIQRYFFPLITPGSDPPMNLASMLSHAADQPNISTEEHYQKIRQGSKHVLDFLTEKIGRPSVIVVDQCEEVLTLCKDREARQAFINNLLELDNSKHRVILCTNVEDFGSKLKRLPNFEKIFERGTALLPRLGTSELSDAINKPADLVGFKFKDQTVKDIVQEIGTLPVALPLLQFTLVKLWERRGTHDEYFSEMGGCRSILTESAEDFLRSLEPNERRIVEELFRRMVRFDYKYRASVLPVQLEARAVPARLQDLRVEFGSQKLDVLVERLAKAQLIRLSTSSTPKDAQVELVHESLIQNWPRIGQWVAQQKRSRFKMASLSAAALMILVVVGLALGGVKAVELVQKFKSHEQASRWARASRKHLNDRRLDTALLLSLAAYQTAPAGDTGVLDRYLFRGETKLRARGALLSALFFYPRPKAFLLPEKQSVGDVAFSPDGRLLAANDNRGRIVIWDLSQRKTVGDPILDPLFQGPDIAPLIFGDDGGWLVTGGAERKDDVTVAAATIWDPVTHKVIQRLVAPDVDLVRIGNDRITTLALSGDSQKLAGLTLLGGVVLWDTSSGKPLTGLGKSEANVTAVALSSDGGILATGDDKGDVILWDVKRGRPIRTLAETCECQKQQARAANTIKSIVFSPDDKMLAVSGTQETGVWSTTTGQRVEELSSSDRELGMVLSFSKDGNTLAGFEGDDQVYLWDMGPKVTSPRRIGANLFQPIMPASSIAFSRDGKTLASYSPEGITLWDLDLQRPLTEHGDRITALAFSPDGRVLASGSNDGTLHLRNTVTRELIDEVINENAVSSLALSHDGKLLAAGLVNRKIKLWRLDEKKISGSTPEERDLSLEVSALNFSFDDTRLVSVATERNGADVELEEWYVAGENRNKVNSSRIPVDAGRKVTAVALSPDCTLVALATDKRDVLIWDVNKKEWTHHSIKELATDIQSLEFSGNRRWLVFGGNNSDSVFRYDMENKKLHKIFLEGLAGSVMDLAFSLDDKIVAVAVAPTRVGYPDGAVVLVDIEEPLVMTEGLRGHDSAVTALAFSGDGRALATGSADKTVLLRDLNTCEASKVVCAVVDRSFTSEEREQHELKYSRACEIQPVVRKECPDTK